jgi:predicted nucleotidyltransferase component of viral defense system
MNRAYLDSVRLLLAVAPAVFRTPVFVLKGGTAINLFLRDMPRLSVDLDLVHADHRQERERKVMGLCVVHGNAERFEPAPHRVSNLPSPM